MFKKIIDQIKAKDYYSGALFLSANEFISIAFGLVSVIALGNWLDQVSYGIYQYIITTTVAIFAISLTGLPTMVSRATAADRRQFLSTAFRTNLRWSLPATLIAMALGSYYLWNGNNTLGYSFLILPPIYALLQSSALYYFSLIGRDQFRSAASKSAIATIVPILILVAALYYSLGVATVLISFFASKMALNAFFYWRESAGADRQTTADPDAQIDIDYAKHLSIINLLNSVAQKIDYFVLFHFLGPVALAKYSFALVIPERIQSLARSVSLSLIPAITRQSKSVIMKKIIGYTLPGAIMIAIGIVITIIAMPFIYRLLLPQYIESVPYAIIYSFSLLALLAILPNMAIQTHRLTKELYVVSSVAMASQIALILVLVPWQGIWGAIIARIINKLILVTVSIWQSRKQII